LGVKVALPEWYRDLLAPSLDGDRPAWYQDGATALAALREAEAFWHELWGPGQPELPELLGAAPELRWLHVSSAGVEWVDLELVRRRRIRLTNGAGLHAPPIAEHAVMCMLMARRGLLPLLRAQAQARWDRHEGGRSELAGARVLILGYGLIGRAIGQKAKALGALVTGVRRRDHADWRALLPESDFLVVAAPLTPATRGIVGARELAAMKEGAWVVNIARGPLVVERALLEALAGKLGGAALDVFDEEPLPAEHPLWRLPNVILTPHVSASTDRVLERSAALFLDNVERFRGGRRLRNLVDLRAGY
jgi:phosphoglycerate dehydrogenase-like enzyme